MTLAEITPLLAQYRAALDTQISLLQHLRALAARELDDVTRQPAALDDVVNERERVMATLLALEAEVTPIRRVLADARDRLMHLPEFTAVVTLHRQAASLVDEVLRTDDDSLRALREAELARRSLAESVERSESTLAAYRRVVMPSIAAATLVNRKG